MKNQAPPLSSGSPRGIHSLPRISVPPPPTCLFSNEGSGWAPLLISPRRLTGAFSPRGSRPASLDMPRATTTTAMTNECSASGSATSSSFVDRRSRTSSESEAISILQAALAEVASNWRAARAKAAEALAAAAALKPSVAATAGEAATAASPGPAAA